MWKVFFNEMQDTVNNIESFLGTTNYTPDNYFRFKDMPFKDIKIVILGQDPYPQPGIATGRAFEVKGLKTWMDKFPQQSLKNMIKLLYKSYYGELLSFDEIKKKIASNEFKILPPNKLFDSWENQGVLLLNTALTCEPGKPGSHRHIWNEFTVELIKFIAKEKTDAIWFLWGNHAISYEKFLLSSMVFKSSHPMLCNPNQEGNFINSNCFTDTKFIDWLGQ